MGGDNAGPGQEQAVIALARSLGPCPTAWIVNDQKCVFSRGGPVAVNLMTQNEAVKI